MCRASELSCLMGGGEWWLEENSRRVDCRGVAWQLVSAVSLCFWSVRACRKKKPPRWPVPVLQRCLGPAASWPISPAASVGSISPPSIVLSSDSCHSLGPNSSIHCSRVFFTAGLGTVVCGRHANQATRKSFPRADIWATAFVRILN